MSSGLWLHDPKEHKEETELRGNLLKVCHLLHIIHPQSIIPIFLITFLNSAIDLLDLTKLGNLFMDQGPRKSTELVPEIVDLEGGMKNTASCLKLYGTFFLYINIFTHSYNIKKYCHLTLSI